MQSEHCRLFCNVIENLSREATLFVDGSPGKSRLDSPPLFSGLALFTFLPCWDALMLFLHAPRPWSLLPHPRRAPPPTFFVVAALHCAVSLEACNCYGRLSAPSSVNTEYNAPSTQTEFPSCLADGTRTVPGSINLTVGDAVARCGC